MDNAARFSIESGRTRADLTGCVACLVVLVLVSTLQIFKTFCLKSETGGFENINPSTRMRPLENLSACPADAGLQFAQIFRGWDQNQPA